jgi:bifunctional non-homologous end joining protein LigD
VFRPDGHCDLIEPDGKDIRQEALGDRRAELARIVSGADAILFSETIEAEGELVFDNACEMGIKGMVSKRVGSRYSSGTTRTWVKTKNAAYERPPRRFTFPEPSQVRHG